MPYYRLLVGLVRTLDARHVLEVGTYYGGTAMAMSHGFDGRPHRLVTVDVERRNDEGFEQFLNITRVHRDALAPSAVRQVAGLFDGPVDLLYVDAGHDYRHTFGSIAVYGDRLRPTSHRRRRHQVERQHAQDVKAHRAAAAREPDRRV